MKIKTKSTKFFSPIIAFIFLLNAAVSAVYPLPFSETHQEVLDEKSANDTENSSEENDVEKNTTTYDNSSFVMVNEIFDTYAGTFSYTNINTLLQYITGDLSATIFHMDEVYNLASEISTSADIRKIEIKDKTSSQDVQVTFGGLTWQVMYLSEDKDGNPILTLWLSDSQQDAWAGRSNTEGLYYGFYDGGLYSSWSSGWYTSSDGTYPSNMYSTSYIRTVTLNNGGSYATDISTLSSENSQSADSVFAMFTMTQDALDESGSTLKSVTDYLVTPRNVSWQETLSYEAEGFMNHNDHNDAWGTPRGGHFADVDYSTKDGYDAWADDYLWLPSAVEAGLSSSIYGIWNTSTSQRQNYDGSTTSIKISSGLGSIKQGSSTTVLTSSVFRTGSGTYRDYSGVTNPYFTDSAAVNTSSEGYPAAQVNYYFSVRPALHLNLNAVLYSFIDMEQDEENGAWNFEDGSFPQTYIGSITPDGIGEELGSFQIEISSNSVADVSIFSDGTDRFAKVTIGQNVGWFKFEPIVWVVSYDSDKPTNFDAIVSEKVLIAGVASIDSSLKWGWTESSIMTALAELESFGTFSLASSKTYYYDTFTSIVGQSVVNNDNASDYSIFSVASVNEIDALGGSYKATCTDFAAFLLSGGSLTSGYAVEYWTRDLAYSLDSTSHYGASSYSGYYNNGVYVTSFGTISNALLTNCFGARLSISI